MDPEQLRTKMRSVYNELIDFVLTDKFYELLEELYALPRIQRAEFVRNNILNKEELSNRGIDLPAGVLLQRSSFGDKRPTLFVVKKYLPKEYQVAWENVNLTFDQDMDKGDVSDDEAWEKPLPIEVQAAISAMGITSERLNEITNE